MSSVIALWWLALPLLLLPVWWHRQRRERVKAQPLATARFLPPADPQQLRVWEWVDRILLLVRCLLLAAVIAWLADLALPWRGDAVLVAEGTDPAWVEQQVKQAGYADAQRIALPKTDTFAWLRDHEREWRNGSRWLVLGQVAMPASLPAFSHRVEIRTPATTTTTTMTSPIAPQRIAIVGQRAGQWRALFAALADPQRFIISTEPAANTDLIIWDAPTAPPATLRAPLWWIGDISAFPELAKAPQGKANSARGRLWMVEPPTNAEQARLLFENWQQLHVGTQPYAVPSQVLPASGKGAILPSGALHELLGWLMAALFAVERMLAHARRR
jgi:hypothetical protein